jgi:hypothetical protein
MGSPTTSRATGLLAFIFFFGYIVSLHRITPTPDRQEHNQDIMCHHAAPQWGISPWSAFVTRDIGKYDMLESLEA